MGTTRSNGIFTFSMASNNTMIKNYEHCLYQEYDDFPDTNRPALIIMTDNLVKMSQMTQITNKAANL